MTLMIYENDIQKGVDDDLWIMIFILVDITPRLVQLFPAVIQGGNVQPGEPDDSETVGHQPL